MCIRGVSSPLCVTQFMYAIRLPVKAHESAAPPTDAMNAGPYEDAEARLEAAGEQRRAQLGE